jgi:hypothetical protein
VLLGDGAAATWEEAAAQLAGQAGRWRALAVARRTAPGLPAASPPEVLQMGDWVLLGDPRLLDEVAARLAAP